MIHITTKLLDTPHIRITDKVIMHGFLIAKNDQSMLHNMCKFQNYNNTRTF